MKTLRVLKFVGIGILAFGFISTGQYMSWGCACGIALIPVIISWASPSHSGKLSDYFSCQKYCLTGVAPVARPCQEVTGERKYNGKFRPRLQEASEEHHSGTGLAIKPV